VHENIVETIERVEETINEVGNDTLAHDEVSDDLDQMIRDGEPEFLDARNLKKLEQRERMQKHRCITVLV
jgi:predicted kinase